MLHENGLFTGVRGSRILRTSPFGCSAKFTYTEFSEVRLLGILGSLQKDE